MRYLGNHWWQGVAAIIGLAALIVAYMQLAKDDRPPAPPANQINGNCNGQGENNTINCAIAPTPRSLRRVAMIESFDPSGIVCSSDDGYLYEGRLTVNADVNCVAQIMSISSTSRPFRWTSSGVVRSPAFRNVARTEQVRLESSTEAM